jgi:hypothetical protein
MKGRHFSIFKRIVYNCEKAQRLSIKKQESKLTPAEWLQHRIHMHYCNVCRKFEQFSALLNQYFVRERQELEEQPKNTLSGEEKKELQRRVDELNGDVKE